MLIREIVAPIGIQNSRDKEKVKGILVVVIK